MYRNWGFSRKLLVLDILLWASLQKDFAEEIIKLTATNQKIVFKSLSVDDPLQRQPDISRAKEILDWEPKVHRSEGLKKVYEYFKSLSPEELHQKEHRDFSHLNGK